MKKVNYINLRQRAALSLKNSFLAKLSCPHIHGTGMSFCISGMQRHKRRAARNT